MSPRSAIAAGAAVTVLGIAIAGTAPIVGTEGAARSHAQQIAGGIVLLVGWAILGWSIHAFGRAKG